MVPRVAAASAAVAATASCTIAVAAIADAFAAAAAFQHCLGATADLVGSHPAAVAVKLLTAAAESPSAGAASAAAAASHVAGGTGSVAADRVQEADLDAHSFDSVAAGDAAFAAAGPEAKVLVASAIDDAGAMAANKKEPAAAAEAVPSAEQEEGQGHQGESAHG